MKNTYDIKMHWAHWVLLSVVGLVSAPPTAYSQSHCQSYWTAAYKCAQGCGSCGSSPGGGGGGGAPTYDYEAARRAQEAAAAESQRQAEAARIERERIAEEKRRTDAKFVRDRDATASTLKGSSGDAMLQLKGMPNTDSSGLKGSGGTAFDTGSGGLKELRGADRTSDRTERKTRSSPAPHTDTSVVDARNVPPGLPKAWNNAIATAYLDAPPGVSDRVRKGFQAVATRDWKVAKAWFEDALNRDPNNAGLKRLVALSDAPQPSNKPKPAPAATNNPNLQLPDPNDIRFLFPGLQAMKDREAPVFKTLPDGRRVQMPQDSDMEFLFGPRGPSSGSAPKPTPTFIIGKNGQLVQVPANSNQKSATYIQGKDGNLIEVPQPNDALLMFSGNSPTTPSKPTGESGKSK